VTPEASPRPSALSGQRQMNSSLSSFDKSFSSKSLLEFKQHLHFQGNPIIFEDIFLSTMGRTGLFRNLEAFNFGAFRRQQ